MRCTTCISSMHLLLSRPQTLEDEDLSVPNDEAILPNAMLTHTDILEIVMNIRNASLRKAILLKQDIDYIEAAKIINNEKNSNQTFNIGESVLLKLDMVMQLPERVFKIEQVGIRWHV
jgi:hypothetical protein